MITRTATFSRNVIVLVLATFASSVTFANSGITYHGRIIKPDGVTPVTAATTQFRIQVRTPGTENCLLWEESIAYDMSSSNGSFALTIADTSATSYLRLDAYSWGLDRVFSNRTNFTALSNCSVGTTYNPSSADGRSLQVYFREQPADPWEALPLTKINFVPLALNSVQLEGYAASEFLKIDPASVYTTLTAANVDTLEELIAGTNNQYLKPATTFTGDVTGTYNATVVEKIRGTNVVATAPTNGQVLKFNGTNWAPAADDTGSTGDASYAAKGLVQINTDQATSGLFIASGVLAMPNVITAGGPTGGASTIPVITYDQKGRLTAVTTATVDDTTKLPLAGGTMTGSINMGTNSITNATSIAATNFSGRNLVLNDNDTNTVTIRAPTDITANYILELPADDGASNQVLTTNGSGVLSWSAPNNNLGLTANQAVIANGTGTALTNFTCSVGQVMGFDGAGLPTCTNVTASGGFINGGNSFGAASTLGNNDNFALNFETNGTTKMTVLANGNVGVGTANPQGMLHLNYSSYVPYDGATGAIIVGDIAANHMVADNNSWHVFTGTSASTMYLSSFGGDVDIGAGKMLYSGASGRLGLGALSPLGPIDIRVRTTLTSSPTSGSTSFTVTSTTGFPSSGTLVIGSETITYSSIAGLTINCTATTSDHYSGEYVFGGVGMMMTDDGNVGIGTSSPLSTLDVNGGIAVGTYAGTSAVSSGVIGTSGKVGIGVTNPSYDLEIKKSTPYLQLTDNSNSPATAITRTIAGIQLSSKGLTTTNKYGSALKFVSHDSSFTTENPKLLAGIFPRATESYGNDTRGGMAIDFATTPNTPGATSVPTVRMTIDQNGYVGIGTGSTAPIATLDVAGHIASTGASATVSSCGTGATISGNDTRGYVTTGTGTVNSCVINFAGTFSPAPICVVTWRNAASTTGLGVAMGTSTLTVAFSASSPSVLFNYICLQ